MVGGQLSRRKFNNPKIYISTPSTAAPQKSFFSNKIWKIFLILGGLILLVWIFFFSFLFKIKNIDVEGAGDEVLKSSFSQFLGKNIFLLNSGEIEQIIKEKQPVAYKVEIRRGLPDTLKIKIENKLPVIIWQTQNKNYFVASDGFILGETQDTSLSNLIKILDRKNIAVSNETQILSASFIDFVLSAKRKVKEEVGLESVEIAVEETTFQVSIKTTGFEIIFDTTRDLDNQINALKTVLDKHKSEITKYVDLRVNGKAYWQ